MLSRITRISEKPLMNHVVIIGYNPTVESVLSELELNMEKNICIIAKTKPKINKNIKYIIGDYLKIETLKKANINNSKCVIVSTGKDADNIMVILILKRISKDIKIVAEAFDSKNSELMKDIGAHVINNSDFGGRLLASLTYEKGITRVFEELSTSIRGNDISQITCPKNLIDLNLKDAVAKLKAEKNILIIAIARDGKINFKPQLNYRLSERDKLIVIGFPTDIKYFRNP